MKRKSISILHIITTIDLGGAEKALLRLVSEQVKAGNHVTIFPLKGGNQMVRDFTDFGAKVLVDYTGDKFVHQYVGLKSIMHSFDIVHAHLPRAEILAALCNSHRKHKLVVTRHNSERFWPNGPALLSILLSRSVVSRTNSLVAISTAVQQFLYSNLEVPRSLSTNVIYYGIDLTSNRIHSRESGVGHNVIGTIARLEPQKNLFFLLRVFRVLSYENPGIELRILGEGSLRSALLAEVNRLGLDNSVEIRAKLRDVPAFLGDLDAFILTSRYEGFGLVLLEAALARVPIIAPFISAIPEVLGSEHPGLVREFSESAFAQVINEMLKDESLKRQTISMQNQRLRLFGLKKMQIAYQQIYESVLD